MLDGWSKKGSYRPLDLRKKKEALALHLCVAQTHVKSCSADLEDHSLCHNIPSRSQDGVLSMEVRGAPVTSTSTHGLGDELHLCDSWYFELPCSAKQTI